MPKKDKRPRPPVDLDAVAALRTALRERTLVAVARDIPGSEAVLGYVVAVAGPDDGWVLLAALDERLHLDGWTAVRLPDVLAVAEVGGPESFPSLALLARGYWPPFAPEGVALGTTGELLDFAGRLTPVVSVFREERDPETVWIGTVRKVGNARARLLRIDEDALWEDEPAKVRLGDITRVEFGGQYEAALLEVGGPPPALPDAEAPEPVEGEPGEGERAPTWSAPDQLVQGGW